VPQAQLLELLLTFLKIGVVMFGGGHAMIPVLRYEVVERHGWLSEGEFLDLVAIAESTPGPVAVNAATYVGYRVAGVLGSAVATAGVVLPAFLTILAVAAALARFYENYLVRSLLNGIRGAVLGLVAAALLTVTRGVFANLGPAQTVATAAIAVAVFAGVAVARLDPVALVALAAAAGLLLGVARVW
jgi:chromate transporter